MSVPVGVLVEPFDRHRPVLVLAVIGLGAAAALGRVGLPPVDLHTPLHRMGIMDPLCGGTRALRLAARGDLVEALRWNPASPLLLLGAASFALRTAAGAITGSWVNLTVAWKRPAFWAPLALALVALEARQQHLAPMLMRQGY